MAKSLPGTRKRVIENTPEQINEQICRQMQARVYYYAEHTELLERRLAELDDEWDMERLLEANAASISLIGILLATRNRRWLALPFGVAGFLLQHALQGWCPPVEIFRRLGVRTEKEINDERVALRALRGDYDAVNITEIEEPRLQAQKALELVEQESEK